MRSLISLFKSGLRFLRRCIALALPIPYLCKPRQVKLHAFKKLKGGKGGDGIAEERRWQAPEQGREDARQVARIRAPRRLASVRPRQDFLATGSHFG